MFALKANSKVKACLHTKSSEARRLPNYHYFASPRFPKAGGRKLANLLNESLTDQSPMVPPALRELNEQAHKVNHAGGDVLLLYSQGVP